MWQTRTFKTHEEMQAWLDKRDGLIQADPIIIANGYGVEWRPLRKILDEGGGPRLEDFDDNEDPEDPD